MMSRAGDLKKIIRKSVEKEIGSITKQNAQVGSREYEEHEASVNEEAKRLGFSKGIHALELGL